MGIVGVGGRKGGDREVMDFEMIDTPQIKKHSQKGPMKLPGGGGMQDDHSIKLDFR